MQASEIECNFAFTAYKLMMNINSLTLQAIAALAHLRAAVLYIMDISGQCGYNIEEQVTDDILLQHASND